MLLRNQERFNQKVTFEFGDTEVSVYSLSYTVYQMPSIILGNGGRATSKRHLDYNAIDFMTVTVKESHREKYPDPML